MGLLSNIASGFAGGRPARRQPSTSSIRHKGFTLIEVMVVVAIIGIIAAIALPNYSDYVIRGKIPDATSILATKRVQLEQFFQDNRTYVAAPACVADSTSSQYFDFSCPAANLSATTFTLQAAGKGTMAGFAYTIDQAATKTSTITASGWAATSTACWITKKGGAC